VGKNVVRQHTVETPKPTAKPPADPVVAGLDGSYVRSRHRQEERHFEVIAGKVIDADGTQHRFAFARNGQATSAEAFAQALAAAGVHADAPATVLCDGDGGLWRPQRETLPAAPSCWTGGTPPCASSMRCRQRVTSARARATRVLPTRRFVAWSVRSGACGTAAGQGVGASSRPLSRGAKHMPVRDVAGIDRLERHVSELLGYLRRNQDTLVRYAARRWRGEPISTTFVESAVNEIIAERMNKKQQMRWTRTTVQSFLEASTAVLNENLEDDFSHRYPGFRPTNDDQVLSEAA
jgi:hypothetical protein